MNNKYNRVVEYDGNNNIVNQFVKTDKEELEIKKKKKELTPKQKALLKYKSELKEYSESLGGYVHMSYVKNELLFNGLDIDRGNISRLIYLSTFIDYNDRQENLLIKYGQHKAIEPMSRADIKDKLKLGDSAFKKFLSNVKDNNLLFEVDKKFYISPDYFSKGNCNFDNKEYTRIYIDTTRKLYENCSPKQHKQLSYTFQLLPLLHYETNILCNNPKEVDTRQLDRLGLFDICELLGISTDKKEMNRFENDLYKLIIELNGNKYYMFKRIITKGGNGIFDYFVINPTIIWSGRNTDRAKKVIEDLVFIENKRTRA